MAEGQPKAGKEMIKIITDCVIKETNPLEQRESRMGPRKRGPWLVKGKSHVRSLFATTELWMPVWFGPGLLTQPLASGLARCLDYSWCSVSSGGMNGPYVSEGRDVPVIGEGVSKDKIRIFLFDMVL